MNGTIKSRTGLKVLFISAEVAPFSSVGGLSQVSYFLPSALKKNGVDIRVFTPKYGILNPNKLSFKTIVEKMEVPTGEEVDSQYPKKLICNIKMTTRSNKEVPLVYLLENMEYFEKRANVYGYSDDHIRFGLLSRGAIEFIKTGEFVPHIIHVNDWHTGYVTNYLSTEYKDDPELNKIATLMSVHNLYQGVFDFDHASELDSDDGKGSLAPFFSERYFKQNALKRGVIHTDIINTVSETYSRELLTEEYGSKLHNLFKELRGKLFGVLNGLDYQDFNPQTDKIIKKNYSVSNLTSRLENKIDLQREFNLEPSTTTPILSYSGRLDSQKGIELIMETIDFILGEMDVQFIVLGPGGDKYIDFFTKLEKKYPKRVGTHLMSNFALPRKIFAGSDIILMPSRYEPGGIVALEAMRYGCIPVVRATGGLADSVIDFDPNHHIGTGFSFDNFSAMSFLTAVVRSLETYRNSAVWGKIIRQAMQQDFSWDQTARKYLDLYHRALKFRKDSLAQNPPRVYREH
jgi:starch synthase